MKKIEFPTDLKSGDLIVIDYIPNVFKPSCLEKIITHFKRVKDYNLYVELTLYVNSNNLDTNLQNESRFNIANIKSVKKASKEEKELIKKNIEDYLNN